MGNWLNWVSVKLSRYVEWVKNWEVYWVENSVIIKRIWYICATFLKMVKTSEFLENNEAINIIIVGPSTVTDISQSNMWNETVRYAFFQPFRTSASMKTVLVPQHAKFYPQ